MTAKEILEELKPLGTESYKRVMLKHGVKEPFFGVKISDLHRIVKRIKKNYQLALDLAVANGVFGPGHNGFFRSPATEVFHPGIGSRIDRVHKGVCAGLIRSRDREHTSEHENAVEGGKN